MRKVWIYSLLLLTGMVLSQALPPLMGSSYSAVREAFRFASMVLLGFIMIRVGMEFELRKDRLSSYGWDYVVAMTAAAFPWVFCALYFIAFLDPGGSFLSWDSWKNALLGARFAAPTSAGILFSMLAAAGLAGTWVFRKARILAIFDDLDTVLLMIPLKMLIVGFKPQLTVVLAVSAFLLLAAWYRLHSLRLRATWPWVLGYSILIAAAAEAVHWASRLVDEVAPVHFEVLLPAFVLGCMMVHPRRRPREALSEEKMSTAVSGAFMVLVGLSLPSLFGTEGSPMPWAWVAVHVAAITGLANLGKMFPLLCYRKEATLSERLALCVGMFPRGEVGAGVLMVSLAYGLNRSQYTVAILSLALNLVLTGVFITIVRRLIAPPERA
jgi:Kef-type K+ transport system membrane component KefB